MMQIFLRVSRLAGALAKAAADGDAARQHWQRDPLAHPALAAMDAVQLADLPAHALRACRRE